MVEEESKELPGWVPLFTSLMILLCAFFIMLVAYSSFDDKRTKAAIGSLRGTFGVSGFLGLFPTGDDSASPIPDSRNAPEANPAKKDSLIEKLRAFKRFSDSEKGIRVQYDAKGLRIDTAERVLFDLGSASIKSSSEDFLGMVSALLVEAGSHALVEGHCDEADVKASDFDSGWELSIERAMAVTNFFVRSGVDPGRLASYGYGEFNPLSKGENKEDEFNRRVTILVDIGDLEKLLGNAEGTDGEE